MLCPHGQGSSESPGTMPVAVGALRHEPRADLDLARERSMDRALVGNLHQSGTLGFRHVAFDVDVPRNFSDVALLRFAIGAIPRVNVEGYKAHREAFGGDPLALGIQAHRDRGTGAQSSDKVVIGRRPGIVTAD